MNRTLLVSHYAADLRPLLAGFRLTDGEREDLATLRGKLVELDSQLEKVSGPVVHSGLKTARCRIRVGAGSADELQAALRLRDDARDVRRTLKTRNAELGREAGRLLEPVFRRAVDTARPRVAKLRADAVTRIKTFLLGADADRLVGQDLILVAVEAAVELLETHARSCADAQSENGKWRPSGETLDRLLASLGEKISGE